ncbi:dimethylaniline monooxygenase [N-oxide-forming] 2 isoform X1 [Zonotrichia albicollis]|uniref:dimethylaniline monooxygenase [N-oxide-forming] 2 isoform X1 n=2 Tax=Zonotrichia albicollis TaxID=44394 RepID=UPI003D80F1D3
MEAENFLPVHLSPQGGGNAGVKVSGARAEACLDFSLPFQSTARELKGNPERAERRRHSAVLQAAVTPACHLLQATMVRRVAVIGAGAGGLASVKCCLDEGLEPTCFESSEDIGGIWRYTDSTDSRRITVYRSVITNTSKEMSCFSDFPFPEDFPNYLPHSLVLEYLRMYAQHFDLLRHIRFQTTVLSVRKCPDFSTSGRWEVVTESHGVRESHVFDAVMVCTGHYQEPYLPLASFPGIESHFKGRYLHSWEYRDVQAFQGKRVLVLGIGNTGGDLSVELSRVAAKVFLSTRSHTWVASRVSDQGFPVDMVSTTRFNSFLDWLLPSALTRRIKFRKFNSWFNHTNYGLASSKSSKFKIIINEELPFCLLSGAVVLKPNVKEFTESSAVFEDGTTEGNIDVVLFATGYNFSFPFLEESVRGSIHDNRSLYNCIFPPQLEQPTLAIIGLIQLTGSIMVGSEMQARWVTGVFAGWNKLPPPSRMMAEVLKRKPAVKRNPSERENLKMSFISYVDKIAACAGVKPSVLRLLLTDPKLGLAIFFGPCSPYQYRLQGRGSWSGARAAILTQWQRSLRPLRTRVLRDSSSSSWGWSWMCLLALPAALTAAWLCSKYPQAGWSPRL